MNLCKSLTTIMTSFCSWPPQSTSSTRSFSFRVVQLPNNTSTYERNAKHANGLQSISPKTPQSVLRVNDLSIKIPSSSCNPFIKTDYFLFCSFLRFPTSSLPPQNNSPTAAKQIVQLNSILLRKLMVVQTSIFMAFVFFATRREKGINIPSTRITFAWGVFPQIE